MSDMSEELKSVEQLEKYIAGISDEDCLCCDSFSYMLQEYKSNLKYAQELEKKEERINDLEASVMGLEAENKIILDTLLRASPKHEEWILKNYPDYKQGDK